MVGRTERHHKCKRDTRFQKRKKKRNANYLSYIFILMVCVDALERLSEMNGRITTHTRGEARLLREEADS